VASYTSRWTSVKVHTSCSAKIINSGLGVMYGIQPAGSNSTKFSNERIVVSLFHIPDSIASWYSSGNWRGNAHSSSGSSENIGTIIGG